MLFCTAPIRNSSSTPTLSPGKEQLPMARNTVRSLCALIATELDPNKVEVLIEELTMILLGDYIQVQAGGTDRELKLSKGSA